MKEGSICRWGRIEAKVPKPLVRLFICFFSQMATTGHLAKWSDCITGSASDGGGQGRSSKLDSCASRFVHLTMTEIPAMPSV